MRIALLGQAAFAERALAALVEHGHEIVHVFAPPDAPTGKPDPLAVKARGMNLPLSQPKSFKSDAAFEHFKTLDADLAILAFVTLIVPERILYAPRFKSICFHPSLLPRHRGASGINWAIIQGDAETGVTWFWPDKGIDTGPILVQRRVPIAETDTVGSIYFNTLFPMGIDAMVDAVNLIKSGNAPAIVQDESKATYEPPCRDEHAKIDFAKPAREVFNLIRGCDPQPGAFATIGEERLRMYEASFSASSSDAAPGTIVAIDSDGMRIALAGGSITVKRARIDPNPKKVAPAELAAAGDLKVGTKLT
ncbi:MAG TPA: methionyl-tRNA formyltransferase [Candidatus Binatus sp.]|uniref:methionyl-tRNA formyltransferase n=1 Tax=Candidatus Binatus sp. TaxID=2811406 RepID=UPI002B4A4180|nr:methionyl-tRNA formyltransferase [Candidatus Binatus sp.]HKN14713.1 methionyl-tRNA formyltransferase [Candidatus Binatus sp.]